ncbi:MAG: DUF3177 family protein [Geminocystis sp.]|nr:DUF3177 family protein [Geminocystis sp.]HIK38261.1 DUF3177 family protein [Geminocystis sp. M7585_C2015_104]MCS7146654.1 DUF3177 family protein [Geminocystis sp.]MCX8077197.1 DUF3177 family protein [Geminocystis sp.]MDW8115480.1 DUF3177 family protein [Geminocystis sp.]
MGEALTKALIWTNYKLFVVVCLILPLVLSFWSIKTPYPSIQRLLGIYWRVSSLLAIAIYLLIPVWEVGYLAWFAGHILIVISLWFWVDINDEIRDLPKSRLQLAITSWRWAVTFYGIASAIGFIPFLRCGFLEDAREDKMCRLWLEAPWHYKAWFHPTATTGFLGFLGMMGLIIYLISFAYFLTFRLIKQGRIALDQ